MRRALAITLVSGLVSAPAIAGLYWQVSIAIRMWNEGLSWRLGGEAFLSWVVQVLVVVGLPIALLGLAHLASRRGRPPRATAS